MPQCCGIDRRVSLVSLARSYPLSLEILPTVHSPSPLASPRIYPILTVHFEPRPTTRRSSKTHFQRRARLSRLAHAGLHRVPDLLSHFPKAVRRPLLSLGFPANVSRDGFVYYMLIRERSFDLPDLKITSCRSHHIPRQKTP
jgi:hypothetical protein